MSLRSFKATTRKEIANKLHSLDQQTIRTQSLATAKTVLSLPEFQNAKSVGLYMHLPCNELHTDTLISECFSRNKTVYLPRIEKLSNFNDPPYFSGQKSCLHFLSVPSQAAVDSLEPRGKYQIREPQHLPDASNDLLLNNGKLDLLFLPGVAFSRTGKRLGHGAGYYDDFIKRYRSAHSADMPLLVGIGLPVQLIDDDSLLHLEDHDEQLDYVIAGSHVFPSRQIS